jgi:kynurenine formamidase
MHLDLLRHYLAQREEPDGGEARPGVNRRTALTLGATAAGLATALGGAPVAAATRRPAKPSPAQADFDDEYFDYADPANLADWAPSVYGAGDQRGALNEVTPDKTSDALKLLSPGRGRRGVTTFQLGELMSNGFPAFVTSPPRFYDQRLVVGGYDPGGTFVADGGILQTPVAPLGVNRVNVHEERFGCRQVAPFTEAFSTTYQIGTQLDNLNHVGAGIFFYNGFTGPDIAEWWGTSALGAENMGPIVTRGVLLDVLGQKVAAGAGVIQPAANGRPVLASNYRITIADLEAAMDFGGIREIQPGDAVMIRTGWNQLLDRSSGNFVPSELTRWGAATGMPGIYLAEARWLAASRPAIIGSDTWALEVLGSSSNVPNVLFPVHQELLMRHGIRIGESVVLDSLAAAHVNEYVHIVTPQFAKGATAGNSPPAGLGVSR